MRVQKLTPTDSAEWVRVNEQEVHVSDRVDAPRVPEAKMVVGFGWVAKGETLTMSFPYDEVLTVTTGAFTVRTAQGEEMTALPGEMIYLPSGSTNTFRAEERTEMTYVAAPPDVYARHVEESSQQ